MLPLIAVGLGFLVGLGCGDDDDDGSGSILPPRPDASGGKDVFGADTTADTIPYDPDALRDLLDSHTSYNDVRGKDAPKNDSWVTGDIPPNDDMVAGDDYVTFDEWLADDDGSDFGNINPDPGPSPDVPAQISDSGSDVGSDIGSDLPAQGSDVPSTTYESWKCTFVATDQNYMKYVAQVRSDQIEKSAAGWSGPMNFKGAEGTDLSLVNERLTTPASTWPKKGQTVESYAENLVARYALYASFAATGSGTLSIENFNVGGTIDDNASMIPMTWFSETCAYGDIENMCAQPIDADTSNEIYVSKDGVMTVPGNCFDQACTTIKGQIAKGDGVFPGNYLLSPNEISIFEFYCTKEN